MSLIPFVREKKKTPDEEKKPKQKTKKEKEEGEVASREIVEKQRRASFVSLPFAVRFVSCLVQRLRGCALVVYLLSNIS